MPPFTCRYVGFFLPLHHGRVLNEEFNMIGPSYHENPSFRQLLEYGTVSKLLGQIELLVNWLTSKLTVYR